MKIIGHQKLLSSHTEKWFINSIFLIVIYTFKDSFIAQVVVFRSIFVSFTRDKSIGDKCNAVVICYNILNI